MRYRVKSKAWKGPEASFPTIYRFYNKYALKNRRFCLKPKKRAGPLYALREGSLVCEPRVHREAGAQGLHLFLYALERLIVGFGL